MVMNILKSDFYKLVRDRQTIALIFIYFIFTIITLISPNLNINQLNADEVLNMLTVDFGMIFLFVTVVAIAIFTLDYSSNTLKDILPYHNRKKVFASKWASTIIVTAAMLSFCYVLGVAYSIGVTGELASSEDFKVFLNRFIVHYVIILANVSFVLFLSGFFKQRYLTNALVLVSLLITRFFPVGQGRFLFHLLGEHYAWGAALNYSFIGFTLLLTCVFIAFGYYCFMHSEAQNV